MINIYDIIDVPCLRILTTSVLCVSWHTENLYAQAGAVLKREQKTYFLRINKDVPKKFFSRQKIEKSGKLYRLIVGIFRPASLLNRELNR